MNKTITLLLLLISIQSIGQKKLIPVTQSEITGISLPAGSKQEKRMLMVVGGKVLLEIETKEIPISKTEILSLPLTAAGSSLDSLLEQFRALGWIISPVQSDSKYFWLQKNKRSVIGYFSINKKDHALYFGETTSASQHQTNSTQSSQLNSTLQQPEQPYVQQPIKSNQENTTTGNSTKKPEQNNITPQTNHPGFTFSTTNFDDGWVSVIKDDWVEVSKPGIKILLRYSSPKNITDGWNTLVLPRYNIAGPIMNDYGTPTWQGINYTIWGTTAKEKATGTAVYVAIFEGPGGNCIEIVADNFETLKKELAIVTVQKVDWDPSKSTTNLSWAKMNDLYGRNKFAISTNDLTGTWYYGDTVKTGNSSNYSKAAVNMITIITHEFNFSPSGQYLYKKGDGSGFDIKEADVKTLYTNYKGKYSAANWEIKLEDTKLISYFFALKNNRILVVKDFNGRDLFLKKVK